MSTDDELFAAALERPPVERAAFLDEACRGDAAQRERLRELLAAYGDADAFLRKPAVARDPVPAEGPGTTINHYKLIQRIGEGGVGVVWMAQQEQPLRRLVALKIIKLGMDTQAVVARFEAERQALAMMDHPNIAKVFDAGVTATGRPYFVMELVRGVPITTFCDEHQLTTPERLALFVTVCEAVQHAHQKGVIHRDLKPSNILVTENGGAAVPKVIDFGIAKATQGRLGEATVFTAFEQFIGTPVYMSPEQADMSSLDVDTRSDIYSLGVLLFELLTGRTPFDAKTILEGGFREVSRRIREVEAERPSQRLATLNAETRATVAKSRRTAPARLTLELRGDLDWIVMRCLEKDRTRRYESASALALDLRRHARDEPILARPPSPLYLAQKLFRRHRAAMTAALATVLVLVVGGGFSTWQAVRATRAEREQTRLRAAEATLLRRAEEQERLARRRAYAADMNLAHQAWSSDNLGLAKRLLDRYRPSGAEADVRGWEWRYLWQLTRSEAAGVLARRPHSVTSLAVSADQNWIALGPWDGGEVTVINLRTRQEIRLQVGTGAVQVRFSPTEPLLALGAAEERENGAPWRVRLWSATTRQFVADFAASAPLHFSADGRMLVTGSAQRGGPLTLRNVPGGELLRELPVMSGGLVAVSNDLKLVAREVPRSPRGLVQVFDTVNGRERGSFEFYENVTALAFSRDGRLLAAAAGNTTPAIQIWDTVTGETQATYLGHRTYVTDLLFWPDGRTLASASTDQTIRVWDLRSKQAKQRVLRGHELEVRSLALLADQMTLVSGAKNGAVFLWDMAAPETRQRPRIDGVANWAFGPGSRDVVTLDPDGVVAVRRAPDFERAEETFRVPAWDGRATGAPRLAPAGGSGGPGSRMAGPAGARSVFASDVPLLAVRGDGGVVRVFDWKAGRLVREVPTGVTSPGIIGFTPGGAQLILVSEEAGASLNRVSAWPLAPDGEVRSWPVALPGAARFTLSPDARHLAIRTHDGEFSVLDFAERREQPIPVAAWSTGAPAFSPNGRWLALPSTAGWVKIWDVSRREVASELVGFVLGVHSAAFSPDGQRLITGSGGVEAVRMWDANEFEPLLALAGEGTAFSSAAFSADGDVIGARNSAGQLHLWRAPSLADIAAAESRAAP